MDKIKTLLGAFLLVLTTNAHSSIIDLHERDYLIDGDGLITYDSSTGLEWLDLTYTQGNSILDTEADANIWANDWQWADSSQISTLFGHGSWRDPQENFPIVSLIGTWNIRTTPGQYIYQSSLGISRNLPGFNTADGFLYGEAVLRSAVFFPDARGTNVCGFLCYEFRHPSFLESDSDPGYGSWLVRTASVPEPSIIALMFTGLFGLGLARRRVGQQRVELGNWPKSEEDQL